MLIGHIFFSTAGVAKALIAKGIRIYDQQQVYRKAAEAQETISRQLGFSERQSARLDPTCFLPVLPAFELVPFRLNSHSASFCTTM